MVDQFELEVREGVMWTIQVDAYKYVEPDPGADNPWDYYGGEDAEVQVFDASGKAVPDLADDEVDFINDKIRQRLGE